MEIKVADRFEQHTGAIAHWNTGKLVDNFLVTTTLPCTEPSHRLWILEIIESECRAGSELIGQEFYVGEYVVHGVELLAEESGELVLARRAVFPQPDGPAISFVSEGVIKSLQKISWAIGREPPWDPPVKVKLKQVATGRGRRTFKLIPVK